MYIQRAVISVVALDTYWSSSESAAASAWSQSFRSGSQFGNNKQAYYQRVRPVRAFSATAIPSAVPMATVAPTTTTTFAPTTTGASCAAGGQCAVGDTGPGGGKVFYVATTNFTSGNSCGVTCRFLEAAPAGWSVSGGPYETNCQNTGTVSVDPNCQWHGSTGGLIGTGTGIGTAYGNTSSMIKQNDQGTHAATSARAYRGGGKTDWSLPSKDDLDQIYLQRTAIGGFASASYWSSSEGYFDRAWVKNFRDGFVNNQFKGFNYKVRPVRAF
jgi:hypothetical protein